MGLAETVRQNLHGVSHFAKFLVAPYCLDMELLNFFRKQTGESEIEEKKVLVAMEHRTFPEFLHIPLVFFVLI